MAGRYGITYHRASCPDCGRHISGGRAIDLAGYWIRLRKHNRKRPHHGRGLINEHCPGSGKTVQFR